jgi:hypothetical protein
MTALHPITATAAGTSGAYCLVFGIATSAQILCRKRRKQKLTTPCTGMKKPGWFRLQAGCGLLQKQRRHHERHRAQQLDNTWMLGPTVSLNGSPMRSVRLFMYQFV